MRTTTEHTMTPPACLRRFSIQRRTGLAREMTRGPTHENPGYELTWVESGRMEFEVGRSVLTATTGACILLPPGLENTPRSRTVTLHQLMLHPSVIAEASDALGGRSKQITDVALIGADERVAALARVAAKEAEAGLDENARGCRRSWTPSPSRSCALPSR